MRSFSRNFYIYVPLGQIDQNILMKNCENDLWNLWSDTFPCPEGPIELPEHPDEDAETFWNFKKHNPRSDVNPENSCTNRLKIPLGSIVEMSITGMTILDVNRYHHPIHIHGHVFYLMAIGYDKHHGGIAAGNVDGNGAVNDHFECDPPMCATTTNTKPVNLNVGICNTSNQCRHRVISYDS